MEAVITGAANGIGKALVGRLSGEGHRIWALDNDKEGLRALERDLGANLKCIGMDVSDTLAWRNLAIQLRNQCDGIDVLITCAAVSVLGPFSWQSIEDIDWINRINYLGTVYAVKHVLPFMQENDQGHIITLGSTAGITGFPDKSTYCASKFAVRGFTAALAAECHGSGIRVMHVIAGPVASDMPVRSRVEHEVVRKKTLKYLKNKGITVERAASEIWEAAQTGKKELLLTRQSKTTSWMNRVMPRFFSNWIGKNKDKLPA